MSLLEKVKELYWNNFFMEDELKEEIFYKIRGFVRGKKTYKTNIDVLEDYIHGIIESQKLNILSFRDFPARSLVSLNNNDPKLIAYYLPQFYPNTYNDDWWGKGFTEWTNTTKAVPQYLGQYQPRLPGELGFYDLRIQNNIYRQIELAKIYGIYGFCFYYYWFDGLRLLDLPLSNYVEDKHIDFPFFICWINESWTKQWSGASCTILIEHKRTVDSYKKFIYSCIDLFSRKNYITINGKIVLNVYRPNNIPNIKYVIKYWREYVENKLGKELYLIATIGHHDEYRNNYIESGFDAISEFSPGPHWGLMNDITMDKQYLCEEFLGKVYDYRDFVINKKYFTYKNKKLYRAICPMWDNTARKMNKGLILDGATPDLYKQWLKDIIVETRENNNLDEKLIFINAWNEWAEGAYLEPDLKWKYGYLEATKDAILQAREMNLEDIKI